MPLPRAFKSDERFLEYLAMGAAGTIQTITDLEKQGHRPVVLERGSTGFKIWKAIKIKRIRVPDILCLSCRRRVESRAKTKLELSMSHSLATPDRGWDAGLDDRDFVAFVHCSRSGAGPTEWTASPLIQYVPVDSLRRTWRAGQVRSQQPKGPQEGSETRVTWPSAVASGSGKVDKIDTDTIRYRKAAGGRVATLRLKRGEVKLSPLVSQGSSIEANQVVASIVPVTASWPCRGGATMAEFVRLCQSKLLSDRYTAATALGYFPDPSSTDALIELVRDDKEHVYVRLEAAAGLMRRGEETGQHLLAGTLYDEYLENRLEAAIVLGEVATPQAAQILVRALKDSGQHAEIRAGAAWSLGEVGMGDDLTALVESFDGLDTVIQVEAARALAKIARKHLRDVLDVFPRSTPEQRPAVAWALSKASGFHVEDVLPILVDEDARHWVSYIVGTQEPERLLPEIERLAEHDAEVYFAVTVLWKIIGSWVYGLEEY